MDERQLNFIRKVRDTLLNEKYEMIKKGSSFELLNSTSVHINKNKSVTVRDMIVMLNQILIDRKITHNTYHTEEHIRNILNDILKGKEEQKWVKSLE